ncbi:MAG: DUF1353 domain-containing protein [Gammaproteobacteria bacterium]|nr:DUF1353 domain-containing protein [Gammaproteobacteria bacterium]
METMKKALPILLALWMSGCAVQTRPVLTPFADGEFWVVTQSLSYPIPGTDDVIVIPQGFVTDFASIPRIFWTVFPRHGEYTTAAIVHDYLYWTQRCTREQADDLFERAMQDAEVSTASRYAIYGAVRLGGGSAWDENARLQTEEGESRIVPYSLLNFDYKTKWVNFRETLINYYKANPVEKEALTAPPRYCTALERQAAEQARLEAEKARAEEEKTKAEEEKARAEEEKAKAEAAQGAAVEGNEQVVEPLPQPKPIQDNTYRPSSILDDD